VSSCPYCEHVAADAFEEISHMEQAHPEIIRERLEAAGIRELDFRDRPDLPSYLTLRELRLVHVFAEKFALEQDQDENAEVSIHVRDRGRGAGWIVSPWIEFKVAERSFAMWRSTSEVYEVGPDGAVGDEPIHAP
jgi:hypothetical protein